MSRLNPLEDDETATKTVTAMLPTATAATSAASTGLDSTLPTLETTTPAKTTTSTSSTGLDSTLPTLDTTTPTKITTTAAATGIDLTKLPYLQSLEGFEHTKLADAGHTTLKYQLGRLFAKYPPTAAGLSALVQDPEFQNLGVQSIGNGNLKLPDGTVIDAIKGFKEGGVAWQFNPVETAATTTPAIPPMPTTGSGNYTWNGTAWIDNANGYSWNGTAWVPVAGGVDAITPGMGTTAVGDYDIPGYGTTVGSDEFTDATTSNLEDLLNWRINELINPVEDPSRQQYADLLQQYIESLSQNTPAITNLIGSLESQAANYLAPSSYETIGNEEIDRIAAAIQEATADAEARVAQLNAEPYTGAEWEMYRTGVLDPIEQDRKAAQDRAIAEMSQRGIDPSSGIGQQMLLEVNRQFDQSRAVEQGNLGRAKVEQRRVQQEEAYQVQQALEELVNSRSTQRTGLAQELADWLANRGERAAELYGTVADIPTMLAQQQLQGAQTLSDLSSSVRTEESSRRAEALALQQLLAELPERRLQLALATLGEGDSPESMVNSLTNLASLSNQRAATQAATNASNWSGVGALTQLLASLFNTSAA